MTRVFLRWIPIIAVAAAVMGWLSVTRADNCPWGGGGLDCGGPGVIGCCMGLESDQMCAERESCQCEPDGGPGTCSTFHRVPYTAGDQHYFRLKPTLVTTTCKYRTSQPRKCFDQYVCEAKVPPTCRNDQDCEPDWLFPFSVYSFAWYDSGSVCIYLQP